ncbi:hypothetical protein PybrP1_008738 [[Pythium] brassicae (nom. inval.)]|nr:hypothetical protein PybrP1_008738 [[Pythium] brassicae (nom. inval.)]
MATTQEPQAPLAVRLSAASGRVDVDAVTRLLQTLPGGALSAVAVDGGAVVIEGAAHSQQQLAVACLAYWTLQHGASDEAPLKSIAVSISANDTTQQWLELHDALGCEKSQLEPASRVRVVSNGDFVEHVLGKHMQIVDCRALDAFLGLDASAEVAGHFDGAWNVPFRSLFALEGEGSSLLPLDELRQVLATDAGVAVDTPVAVLSSDASEAALVATCLVLAGRDSVSLCRAPLTDELVAKVPTEFTSGIFHVDQLIYPGEAGAFDLSPSTGGAASAIGTGDTSAKELDDAYSERISGKKQATDADDDSGDKEETPDALAHEVVWVKDGKRFFDMPAPITKHVFLDASLAILRVVSFVLAPYGFPAALRDRFSLAEVKAQFGSLFQDVIEVCSDLVYSLKGLNEGAMALSVHKWVEEKRDPDCSARVREINDLWSVLYQVPRVVEVPDLPDERVVGLATTLKAKLDAAVHKRAAWALDTPNDSEDDTDDGAAQRKVAAGWQCMYPGAVYALGFIPREPAGGHKKLSTLQIKSLIQAVAEATWDVVGDEGLSQIEFQALCDTVAQDADKAAIEALTDAAEQSLYVAKHFLTRAVPKDDGYANVMAAVRSAVEDGNRQLRSGRHQLALAAFAKAFAHLPLFHKDLEKALVGRANCLVQLGQLGLARAEAETALRLNPFSADAYSSLGAIDEQQARPEAAMQHFVTAFILDGSRSTEHAEAIDRVSRLVGRSVAKDVFSRMVMVHELPSPWLTQSYFESFEHDADNGAKVPFDIAKSVGAAPDALDAETLLYRAIHHKRQQQFREAQRDVCAAVEAAAAATLPTDLRALALNLHASFLYVAGDVRAALEAISASLALKPSLVNSLVKKGGFLSELGELEAATLCFEEAMALDPNDADVHLHQGQMELLDGSYARAVQSLRRAMSRSEALAVTHVSYGMALYKCGSVFQANDVFEDAVKAFPRSPEVHLFQGEVLADQGNYADAMKHFLQAFELSPACPLPFLNAGRVYVSTNDPMRAIAHFEQALAVDPRCSSAHLDIAQVLFAQGRTREAFEHFDAAATCCRFLPEVEEVCASRAMAKMQLRVTEILGRVNHPAFSYAVLVSLAGGAGYVLKRHLPSLVGGTALGVAFLGAGMLAITDTISEHTFAHSTSLGMSGVIAGVMGRRALLTGLKAPVALASVSAVSMGYHLQQLVHAPPRLRYIPGARYGGRPAAAESKSDFV